MSKILVVDDDEQIRVIARMLLEEREHEIFEAHNGLVAVDFCKENNIDLVLMDIQMPVMDGLTATKIIKSEIDPEMKIIAVTSKAEPGDKEDILMSGCDGYIKKPILPGTFPDFVQAYL